MFDGRIRHPDLDRIQSPRHLSDPLISADGCDPESHHFIWGRGGYIDGVIDAVTPLMVTLHERTGMRRSLTSSP